ncbi:MAG: hypothetical protein ABWZ16_10110, partial [Microbacterium sp.]
MYPWDLVDMGVDEAIARLADEGFGAFELTSSYHPITLHTPGRSPGRIMHLDQGGVAFPARISRYGRIRPRLLGSDILSAWPAAASAAQRHGLKMSVWTVAFYQPWIAAEFPETARVTPQGFVNPIGVCVSSPDVRQFMATLVEDIVSQFDVRTVQLEGVTHPYVDTGWLMPRNLVDGTPWLRRLDSLCFCGSCVARAEVRGVDHEGLRRRVVAELEDHYREGTGDRRDPDVVDAERRAADADYAAFLAMRADASAELIEAVSDAIAGTRATTGLGIWGPLEYDGTTTDLERVLPRLSVLQTRQPAVAPDNARAAREIADRHGLRVSSVQWCGGHIGPDWGPGFEAALRANVEFGVDQINLFNWGMIPPRITRQIVPLLRRVEAELAAV